MKPVFFADQYEFRAWLEENHQAASELIVGYWKVSTGKPSMTWSESVDQALCFGWIDGVRRSLDSESYTIRFSPRKPKSGWSAVNIAKVEALMKEGMMTAAGIAAFELRHQSDRNGYRYQDFSGEFTSDFEELFRANSAAWDFYEAQPPGYKRISRFWVMSAKQEKTRRSRLEKLINASETRKRI